MKTPTQIAADKRANALLLTPRKIIVRPLAHQQLVIAPKNTVKYPE